MHLRTVGELSHSYKNTRTIRSRFYPRTFSDDLRVPPPVICWVALNTSNACSFPSDCSARAPTSGSCYDAIGSILRVDHGQKLVRGRPTASDGMVTAEGVHLLRTAYPHPERSKQLPDFRGHSHPIMIVLEKDDSIEERATHPDLTPRAQALTPGRSLQPLLRLYPCGRALSTPF